MPYASRLDPRAQRPPYVFRVAPHNGNDSDQPKRGPAPRAPQAPVVSNGLIASEAPVHDPATTADALRGAEVLQHNASAGLSAPPSRPSPDTSNGGAAPSDTSRPQNGGAADTSRPQNGGAAPPDTTRPRNGGAAYRMGQVLYARGRLSGASAAWRLAASQGHADAAISLGMLCERQGDRDGARQAYEIAKRFGDPIAADRAAMLEQDV